MDTSKQSMLTIVSSLRQEMLRGGASRIFWDAWRTPQTTSYITKSVIPLLLSIRMDTYAEKTRTTRTIAAAHSHTFKIGSKLTEAYHNKGIVVIAEFACAWHYIIHEKANPKGYAMRPSTCITVATLTR